MVMEELSEDQITSLLGTDVGIRPINRRVAVQLVPVEATTRPSGIVLPNTDSVDTYKAEVIAVGTEAEYVEVGDQVLLSIGAIMGGIFEHRQEKYGIVDERDILAVLDRE